MKNFYRGVLFLIMLAVIVLQFFKPDISMPTEDKSMFITAKVRVPETIQRKLEVSCFDCHSYKTKLPWYSSISPIVYLIKHDVEEGREQLNFSTWTDYDRKEMTDKLDKIGKEVKNGNMPKFLYRQLHPSSKLSDEEEKLLTEWAEDSRDNLLK